MKKLLLLAVIMHLTLNLNAQTVKSDSTTKIVSSNLMEVRDLVTISTFDKVTWKLNSYGSYPEYAPIKADAVMVFSDSIINAKPVKNGFNGQIKEYEKFTKYKSNVDSLFKRMKLIGSDKLGEFIVRKTTLPVRFCTYNDTALTVFLQGVSLDVIYNTLRLTNRQRATTILTKYILPSLEDFCITFPNSEIKYYAMACLYGAKDFTKDRSTPDAEYICFVVRSDLAKKYIKGEITEDEVVDASDIYISDKDMVGGYKKIKVILE